VRDWQPDLVLEHHDAVSRGVVRRRLRRPLVSAAVICLVATACPSSGGNATSSSPSSGGNATSSSPSPGGDSGTETIDLRGASGLPGRIIFETGAPQPFAEMNPDGSGIFEIPIDSPICCLTPALSPDGGQMVFVGEGDVSVANVDGTQVRSIWNSPTDSASNPVWSPSGTQIAFWQSHLSQGGQFVQQQELVIVNVDGSGLRSVLQGGPNDRTSLAWSPDGAEIAFVSPSGAIDAVSVNGGEPRQILGPGTDGFASLTEQVGTLSWAPAPSLLFQETNSSGAPPSGIQTITADGDGLRTVLSGADYSGPSWSPDGAHFLVLERGRIVVGTLEGVHDSIGPEGVLYAQWGGPTTTAPISLVDNDEDGIPDELEQQLAIKYAPDVLFAPNEPNFPVNVEWFLQRSDLSYEEKCYPIPNPSDTHVELRSGPLQEDDLLTVSRATTCGNGAPEMLSSREPRPDGHPIDGRETYYLSGLASDDREGSTDPHEWTTYFHAYPTDNGGIMIQYWHLFAFNDFQTHGNNIASRIDQHPGDWDAQVQVQLDGDLRPESVWFSRHQHDTTGDQIAARKVHWTGGTHPIVTVDAGGHAAYASPDDFCGYHPTFAGSQLPNPAVAVWSDAATAESLREITCDGNQADDFASVVGGTVWSTRPSGPVDRYTSSRVEQRVTLSGSVGGLLVNLGEYNPGSVECGYSTGNCVGLPQGANNPLNDQIFLGYSGLWGDPTQSSGVGHPPRGPVFQGFRELTQRYETWYNQASKERWAPAAPGDAASLLALGDSVAAGYGLGESQGFPDNLNAYPMVLADAIGAVGFDYAVSGACADSDNAPTCARMSVPEQLSMIPADFEPAIVTLTVGADDIQFGDCIEAVVFNGDYALRDPTDPCTPSPLGVHLDALQASLTEDLLDIHALYPEARIFIMEYYDPFPPPALTPARPCVLNQGLAIWNAHLLGSSWVEIAQMFVTDHDELLKQARSVQNAMWADAEHIINRLNNTIDVSATQVPGVRVVSTNDRLLGHDMCSGEQWVFTPTVRVLLDAPGLPTFRLVAGGTDLCTLPARFEWNRISESRGGTVGFIGGQNCVPHPNESGANAIASAFQNAGAELPE
jgi:GDSL-like lipase/acylhydrolase family protein